MKATTAQERLYERLNELMPGLVDGVPGQTWVCAPTPSCELAIYCEVCSSGDAEVQIELAHGATIRDGMVTAGPMYIIRLDPAGKTATVLAYQDDWRFETAISDSGALNPKSLELDQSAASWMQAVSTTGASFTLSQRTLAIA